MVNKYAGYINLIWQWILFCSGIRRKIFKSLKKEQYCSHCGVKTHLHQAWGAEKSMDMGKEGLRTGHTWGHLCWPMTILRDWVLRWELINRGEAVTLFGKETPNILTGRQQQTRVKWVGGLKLFDWRGEGDGRREKYEEADCEGLWMSSGHTTGFDSCFLLCDIKQIMTFLWFLWVENVDNACIPSSKLWWQLWSWCNVNEIFNLLIFKNS